MLKEFLKVGWTVMKWIIKFTAIIFALAFMSVED